MFLLLKAKEQLKIAGFCLFVVSPLTTEWAAVVPTT